MPEQTPPLAEIAWSANDCWSCHERGHACSPGAQPPVVKCPGEECATCDYASTESADCDHEWLDRPESDTRECLICGTER